MDGNKIIMLSRNIKAGQYKWQPQNIEQATALIAHLQTVIVNKDKRYETLAALEAATQRENDLLYKRIFGLKKLLQDIGIKTV